MNKGDSTESDHQLGAGQRFGKKTVGSVLIVVFIAAYSFAQPLLNERMGWNLPALKQDSNGQIVADSDTNRARATDATHTASTSQAKKRNESKTTGGEASKSTKTVVKEATNKPATKQPSKQTETKPSTTKRGPLADRMRPSKTTKAPSPRGPPTATQTNEDLRYGLLRNIGRERYMSPAGLQYGPGSAEGHRLEHLRRHTKDDRGRPAHGVFDGDMEGALKTIDRAYEKAKLGTKTTKKVDQGRTIYKVDMGKRIGFLGGRAGAQKRNPMARRVQLVLDGNQVITAYPVE